MVLRNFNMILITLIIAIPQCYSNDNNFNVVNIRKDTVDIRYCYSKCIYVFSKSESCHDCYKKIDFLKNFIAKNCNIDLNLVAITPLSSNYFNNVIKDYLYDLMSLDSIFYDLPLTKNGHSTLKKQTTLFDIYNVDACPSLLLVNKEHIKFIAYNTIFTDDEVKMKETINDMINFFR